MPNSPHTDCAAVSATVVKDQKNFAFRVVPLITDPQSILCLELAQALYVSAVAKQISYF